MKEVPSPYAGMGADVLSNYDKIVAQLKTSSVSKFGFKAQEGKFIPFLTPKQLAQQTSISEKTWERLRKNGGGPPFMKIGNKRIRYPIVGLDDWCTALMQQ